MSIQNKDAIALANSTTAEQKANCDHSFEKEYFLGAATDDYVCTKCGYDITRAAYFKRQDKD